MSLSAAGAFAAFFTTAYEKRHETEFIVRGIKRRRQDPLPEVPKEFQPADLIPNGSVPDESNYATIPGRPRTDASPYAIVPPPSIKSESDSAPSSPNRIPLNPSFNHYNEVRSRSSTQDTPESVRDDDSESLALEIPHDETGLYAQVIKHIKEKRRSELMENDSLNLTASDFEDDIEMMWCDNVAYDTGLNRSAERPGNSLAAAANDNRQYNTVPYSRGSKLPAASSKYATIGATSKIHEYAEIDQMRTVFTKRQSQNSSTAPLQDGYEPDSLSSLSSKSKDSLGSQGDEPHLLGLQRKIELFNKINSGRLSPKESPSGQRKDLNQKDRFYNSVGPDKMWTGKEEDTKENMKAPLAEEVIMIILMLITHQVLSLPKSRFSAKISISFKVSLKSDQCPGGSRIYEDFEACR